MRILGEPVDVVSRLGVDSGGDAGVAVVAPGDDAAELAVGLADERAARVSVAGGVALEAGADLELGPQVAAEADLAVPVVAVVVAHDHVLLVVVKLVGGARGGAEGAPAGERGHGADLELVVHGGHVDCLHRAEIQSGHSGVV